MLLFISMVNNTFVDTTLYVLTLHYSLIIQREDNWEDDWFVKVYSIGDGKYQFAYTMPESKSPWRYAWVNGQANTIDEAKEFLIIAMTESKGWPDCRELIELYNN